MTRLNEEQSLINQDPSSFGLVKVNQSQEMQVGSKSFDLQATVYLNLRDPAQAQISWKAFATGSDLESIPIDMSPFSELNAPGAQMTNFSIPTSHNNLVFCMSAMHPALKERYTAKWRFTIRSNESSVNISRSTQDVLVLESADACK